jgi:hypothetical protein
VRSIFCLFLNEDLNPMKKKASKKKETITISAILSLPSLDKAGASDLPENLEL